MNKNRAAFFVTVFSLTALFGCSIFPHATVDYSDLGQTRLDSELKTHWPTGTEPLRRDVQEIVDSYSVQDYGVSVENLEAMSAHCFPASQDLCQYTGVIRYRLFGLPDPSKDGKLTTVTYQINIHRQAESAYVTVEKRRSSRLTTSMSVA